MMYNIKRHEKAQKVQSKYLESLFAIEDVNMVAIQVDEQGEAYICVGFRVNKPYDELPKELDGIPVVGKYAGNIVAQAR